MEKSGMMSPVVGIGLAVLETPFKLALAFNGFDRDCKPGWVVLTSISKIKKVLNQYLMYLLPIK
jgi:hypothetical protein